MISSSIFALNVDTYIGKSWNIRDQLVSFAHPFVASTQSTALLLEPVIIPLGLTDATLRVGYQFEGSEISLCLLNQALEYFQKALYNFNSQYILAKAGYSTWAGVTNYYSSYFSIYSLLSLQGRAITRIRVNGVDDIVCLLHPTNFRDHEYVLTTKGSRDATHKMPWNRYYDIYNRYTCLKQEFDVVQMKSFTTDPIDESEARNTINYKIFEGFQEIISIANITTFKTQYLGALSVPALGNSYSDYLASLHALASDPELKYFARSAIRLLLIKEIFDRIGNVNPSFRDEIQRRIPIWQSTMFESHRPPQNYFEDFINIFLV